MEFDIKKLYTTVNAEELKVGSKVIVADVLGTLKQIISNVTNDTLPCEQETIKEIKSEYLRERFVTNRGDFGLCYLISEPEEKKLKWTDLKIGDTITNGKDTFMIIGIDTVGDYDWHILAGDVWIKDTELKDWEKVE